MIRNYFEKLPKIAQDVFVAESADIIGDVEVKEGSSIWYRAVLRGDINKILIGKCVNIQDGCVLHSDRNAPTIIGDFVTIGHNAIVHGAVVKDRCLIGMGAVILNGAVIGEDCIIAAGSVVTQGKEIPPRSLVMGTPAKVVRELTDEEIESIKKSAIHYKELAEAYR
ncbi:gamma carbonic anhydrase family protein [Thermobrachium celere]|uniref:Carbonic anhydrase, family 3 n=3 Tax=Thermobrachium TaxID=150333 RepID=R7RQG6_9CLOT|nr:gamma carbonic anhydrase family protein [Thermobrachium celere]GFR35815.1 gamma carbonic anhydrase family protein [Thermobrachium celere]CDF58334.1 carbonic anhydrase, family 3 [Thermobrachium celere DSM 8682]